METRGQKKILIITRNMPPLVGGMERLNWHMADELSKKAKVRVIGPKGAAKQKPELVKLSEAPLKPLPLFLFIAFFKGLWIALRWKPDVILAGSGLTAPLAWLISKTCNARPAAYLHGLDITVNNGLYRKLWRPTFKKLDHVIANSSPTRTLALAAGVEPNRLYTVHPGTNLPELPKSSDNIAAFKNQYGLSNKSILLSVGRLASRKGLKEFVEKSLPTIVQAAPNCMLVVIGETPKNSLDAETQSVESILTQAEKSGVSHHIKFLGTVSENLLNKAYEAADVHIFPIRHIPNNPEGFGMVAIEAAAHGLPTVAFATGGVVDAVSHGVSGYLVTKDSYAELSKQVIQILQAPLDSREVRKFAEKFSWHSFGEQLWTCLTFDLQKPERKAHAVLDLSSRELKAKKIETLLELDKINHGNTLRLLEIGCGSGGIAHYFATHPTLQLEVTAVDIHDNRKVTEGFKFLKVDSVKLPFEEASFDIVITNHVIEHVGEAPEQLLHTQEIKRVLSPNGISYLAVPNRWMLTEPHYNLKFLSWLPRSMRSRYLRWSGKGDFYDCEPLALGELENVLEHAAINFENITIPALKATFELESPHSIITKTLRKLPDSLLNPFKPIIPTLIYRLKLKHK